MFLESYNWVSLNFPYLGSHSEELQFIISDLCTIHNFVWLNANVLTNQIAFSSSLNLILA